MAHDKCSRCERDAEHYLKGGLLLCGPCLCERKLKHRKRASRRTPEQRENQQAYIRAYLAAHGRRLQMPEGEADRARVYATYRIASWLREVGCDVEVDHVVPVARGGQHAYENLRVVPTQENRSKRDRAPTPEEA